MTAPTARPRGPLLLVGVLVRGRRDRRRRRAVVPVLPPRRPRARVARLAAADRGGDGGARRRVLRGPGRDVRVRLRRRADNRRRAAAGLDGTWAVDSSIGSLDDGTGTFVGYRVQEQLATVGAAEAVGRTSSVTGSLTIDGTSVSAAEFTADLTTLQSDEANRDRQLSRQALQTSQFPTATFTLTQPIDLGGVPADGQIVQATATGRPHAARGHEVRGDPAPGEARRRRDHRRGLAPDHLRRLGHPAAAGDDRALRRGPRDDGGPAPLHARLSPGRRSTRSQAGLTRAALTGPDSATRGAEP